MPLSELPATFLRRLVLATVLWILFWPIFWIIRLGEFNAYQAFYWIIGELNYPGALVVFFLVDKLLTLFKLNVWLIFFASVGITALSVPLYYYKLGFPLGVFLESYLF